MTEKRPRRPVRLPDWLRSRGGSHGFQTNKSGTKRSVLIAGAVICALLLILLLIYVLTHNDQPPAQPSAELRRGHRPSWRNSPPCRSRDGHRKPGMTAACSDMRGPTT